LICRLFGNVELYSLMMKAASLFKPNISIIYIYYYTTNEVLVGSVTAKNKHKDHNMSMLVPLVKSS